MGKWGGRAGPLSGVDAQRAMLDEMMGMNRNLDNPDAEITDYRDEVRLTVAHPSLSNFPLALGLGRSASLDSATYLPDLLPLSISPHLSLPPPHPFPHPARLQAVSPRLLPARRLQQDQNRSRAM